MTPDTGAADPRAPFDTALADRLMADRGLDVLLVNSGHNTRYLLGGHAFFFFQSMQALGHSRYLPLVVYARERLDEAAYVGSAMEAWDHALRPFWMPHVHTVSFGTRDAARCAVEHLKATGRDRAHIGIEPAFLTVDAMAVLRDGLPEARFGDATGVLERLRAVKRPDELDRLRQASERIVEAMQATVAGAGPGTGKAEIVERMRQEETRRGLHFDYCLVAMGADRNRAPSDQRWQPGEVLSIDSGGNLDGYIGDLCRMAVLGPPDAELQDLLAEVDATQQAAFAQLRAGAAGRTALERGNAVLAEGPNRACTDLVIHGMGLVSHEAPFLMSNRMYDGEDADAPLEAGMVLSVETSMNHPRRGLVKLEDTVALTADGCEMFGGAARGWNVAGS
ncbi:M24 family metallopeptidase [Rhodobacteraceae bacterium 2CG4]|uniref:M24 family metallopeptidase n=1 Tax=Halovulum marinum TaxID=2662447 RepID=A0A6L5YZK6_9RHOB|nr:Xaa-Pro peptidase family protein [Halovulum marinum]MSU89668.1 M24 family metallopeptidase [Halovulum marinum]